VIEGWADQHALLVEKLRDPARRSWIGASVKHPLSGIASCGVCSSPMCVRTRTLRTRASAVGQIVELAVLGAEQERPELLCRVDQHIPARVPRVAHRDAPAAHGCELYTRAIRVAVPALAPLERRGTHRRRRQLHRQPTKSCML
jgi:hypothetical protein